MCVCICSNQAETCFGWNQKSRTWSSANNSWKSLVAANFCPQAILRPFSGHSTLLMFLPLNLDLIWLEMTRLPVRCNYVFPYNPSYTVWRPGNPFEINEGHLFDRNQILRVGKHSIWAFRTYRISSTANGNEWLSKLFPSHWRKSNIEKNEVTNTAMDAHGNKWELQVGQYCSTTLMRV